MSTSPKERTPRQVATPDAASDLVARRRQFLGFIEKRVGSRAIAEDILQDAFVKGMGKLDTLRSDESAVAWFYRVLRNSIVDHRRRNATAERTLAAFQNDAGQGSEYDAGTHHAVCRCVSELATTLNDKYRDALQKVELDGLGVKAYAEAAQLSTSNAGVRLFRAREALRKRVLSSCGACASDGCLDCTCRAGTRDSLSRRSLASPRPSR
jgi:RNA polymerase sigma factor (sigma-70 family)